MAFTRCAEWWHAPDGSGQKTYCLVTVFIIVCSRILAMSSYKLRYILQSHCDHTCFTFHSCLADTNFVIILSHYHSIFAVPPQLPWHILHLVLPMRSPLIAKCSSVVSIGIQQMVYYLYAHMVNSMMTLITSLMSILCPFLEQKV